MKTRVLFVSLALLLAASLVATACAPQPDDTSGVTRVTIGTGGTGGVYFPLGSAYAAAINKYHSDTIDARAITTGASIVNARLIADGDAQAVLIQNDSTYYASRGIQMFDDPIPELVGLASWYPETSQWVTLPGTGITSLSDLRRGHVVAIGAPGSGTAIAAEQVLRAIGVWDDIEADIEYLAFSPAVDALKLGDVDVAHVVAGWPTAAIVELGTTQPDLVLLEVPGTVLADLIAEGYTFYASDTIPANTYGNWGVDTGSVAMMAMLAVHSGLSDDIVYTMTDVLWNRKSYLEAVHVRGSDITLDTAFDGMPVKIHPGAVAWYEANGVTVPSHLK